MAQNAVRTLVFQYCVAGPRALSDLAIVLLVPETPLDKVLETVDAVQLQVQLDQHD